MAKKGYDRSRAILERIVGTKSKADLADKFKEAFAEKYGIKSNKFKLPGTVIDVAASSDGVKIAAASNIGLIMVWNTLTLSAVIQFLQQ